VRDIDAGPRLFAAALLIVLASLGAWGALRLDARAALDPGMSATRIDVNRADSSMLRLLPGIGPTLAERIIESRTTEGAFGSLTDLERVHRIGPRTVQGLRDFAAPLR
jgi:hypothetical protein